MKNIKKLPIFKECLLITSDVTLLLSVLIPGIMDFSKFFKQIAVIIIFFVLGLFSSCNIQTETVKDNKLERLMDMWERQEVSGDDDSLIMITRPILENALNESDTLLVQYAGIQIIQTFLYIDEIDSAARYIGKISSYTDSMLTPSLEIAKYNIDGVYAIKCQLDYSFALESYIKAYHSALRSKDWTNSVVMLNNIVHIFLSREDTEGTIYAEKAMEICETQAINPYLNSYTRLFLAFALILEGETDRALELTDEALDIAETNNYQSLLQDIDICYSEIYCQKGQYGKAETYLKKLFDMGDEVRYYNQIKAMEIYGDVLSEQMKYPQAVSKYTQSLALSDSLGLIIPRSSLLKKISDSYYNMMDYDSAAYYNNMNISYLDSLAARKDDAFNHGLRSLDRLEHQLEIKSKELDLANSRKMQMLYVFLVIMVSVISGMLYIMFRKQRKMYSSLLSQYERFQKRHEAVIESYEKKQSSATKSEYELFTRVDKIMRENKLYASQDISLEKLAEISGTNRTYLSRAINNCSKMSFYNYIDTFRIREAVRILGSGENVTLKQLSEDLGYSSVQAFSRSFQKEVGCAPGKFRKGTHNI